MLNADGFTTCVFVLLALVSPTLAQGQAKHKDSAMNSARPFAAIDAGLLAAAETAMEAPKADASVSCSVNGASQTQVATDARVLQSASMLTRATNEGMAGLVGPILAKEGVPEQLAAVIRIESGGNPMALSPKGARGLWQLMPDTARRYGLRVDDSRDERTDVAKSTATAARYLRDLYAQFGSWSLALAGYNAGEQRLQRAIEHAGSRDFLTLSAMGYLPAETRNYVPAVLNAMRSEISSAATPGVHPQNMRVAYAVSRQTEGTISDDASDGKNVLLGQR